MRHPCPGSVVAHRRRTEGGRKGGTPFVSSRRPKARGPHTLHQESFAFNVFCFQEVSPQLVIWTAEWDFHCARICRLSPGASLNALDAIMLATITKCFSGLEAEIWRWPLLLKHRYLSLIL